MARSESFENGTNSESFVLSSGFGDHLFLFFPSIMLKIRPRASEPLFQSAHLCIRGIGIHEVMPPCFVRRPDGTGDYLFMIFHSPVQIGDLETTPVKPGMMVLWERGAAHFYGNPALRWAHSWIHCDGRDIRKAWKAVGIHTGQPIRLSNPSRAEDYLLSIYEELTGPMEPDGVIIRNTLGNLIQEAARSRTRPQTSPIPENLLFVREFINTTYNERVTLDQLAAKAGLSVSHFCTEFRQYFGTPPIAYLIQRRMHVAARLLCETTMRVGEIGRHVGYDDPYYFSKHFKDCFGMPPSRFAKRD